MLTFQCTFCSKVFDAEGIKTEYTSPVYGPCFKYIAYCYSCGNECNEYRKPLPKKNNASASTPHCCQGCCHR